MDRLVFDKSAKIIAGALSTFCLCVLVLTAVGCQKKSESSTKSVMADEFKNPPIELKDRKEIVLEEDAAGIIFGEPVLVNNYLFAKRVHGIFQMEDEKELSLEDQQRVIFKNLIYSYQAFKREIDVTSEEMDQWIDSIFRALDIPINRKEDPEGYKKWVEETLFQDVDHFENQMFYMAQIEKLKREIVKEMVVEVTEEEMLEDFYNIGHHVQGDYALFESKEEADAFYSEMNTKKWEKIKKDEAEIEPKEKQIKPFSMITLQAIIDLWGVDKETIYEFHSQKHGAIFRPMQFGRKWGVFRLMDKKSADLNDFEEKREYHEKRVRSRNQHKARDKWLDDIIEEADLQIFVDPEYPENVIASQENLPKTSN